MGDRIRIPSLGQTAEVLSGPDANEDLTVRFGMMKMTVKLAEIESLDGQKPETKELRRGIHEFLASHPQVSRFELASQKEGGGGVTIAFLK